MIHPNRIFFYRKQEEISGPVVYWMQRDQRFHDNLALYHARELAIRAGQPLIVVFCLVPAFLEANLRSYGFMLRGLQETAGKCHQHQVGFVLLQGLPTDTIPPFLDHLHAGCLVTDFNPLKIGMKWRKNVCDRIRIPFLEVDAHNVLPCRAISDKAEFSAYTLRRKISPLIMEYLTPLPVLKVHPVPVPIEYLQHYPWEEILAGLQVNRQIGEIDEIMPGGDAADRGLEDFISHRLLGYHVRRNDPNLDGQSGLSPWLHFGHLSAHRAALAVQAAGAPAEDKQAFLEELIVRRELSDNFCLYNPRYDAFDGFHPWAKLTLNKHRSDQRQFLYTTGELEQAATHDRLWNAAQKEMMVTGKMHGYLRMYWAKKILEWSFNPEEAMASAIFLNDRYSIDGRDPNGYAGIAWSIGGVHDRAWGERPVFGTIRYMNDKGCSRKFDVPGYIHTWLGK